MAAPLVTRFKDGRYCLSYYLDGRRVRETFAHSKDAQGRAREIERLKGKGLKIASKEEVAVDEAAQYATSALLAKGISKPLTAVIDEYIAAYEVLGPNGAIIDAFRAYVANQDKIIPIKVPDLVADYEQYLVGQKVSKLHGDKTIKIYLKRFAANFQMNIHAISLKDLERWRATFTTEPRTINNYCNAVKALFNYAQNHKHLRTTGQNEASRLKDIAETPTEPDPFTIQEMALLLVKVDDKADNKSDLESGRWPSRAG